MMRLVKVFLVASLLVAGSAASAEEPLSYPKGNGLRILSTGHSWVEPAMKTLNPIALAAGLDGHHLRRHTSGGSTGSARSIWASEHGLGYPAGKKGVVKKTILLPAIATGQWDVMTWGAFPWDKSEDFTQWIDVCLKANPKMIFYLQDGWPRAEDGTTAPGKYAMEKFLKRQTQINAAIEHGVNALNAKYPGKLHVIPIGDGVCELLKLVLAQKLPYIKTVDSRGQAVPGIYKDGGHLDAGNSGMDWFEGYVYYATLYKRSPELIQGKFKAPDAELDKVFRRVAWQVVTHHRLSGVTDKNGNRIGDEIE